VNPFSVKLIATVLSGGLMGAGGAFYVQVFQYIDPGIAFGAHTSVAGAPPRRLSVSAVADLGSASLSFSSLSGWADRGLREHFLALTDAVWRVRAFGDFFSYCLLAEGAVDLAAEPEVKLWDLAALDVLVREAGGEFTSIDGRPGPHGGSAVATNHLLHPAVLAALTV
jgi:histidinol-phosphatase